MYSATQCVVRELYEHVREVEARNFGANIFTIV